MVAATERRRLSVASWVSGIASPLAVLMLAGISNVIVSTHDAVIGINERLAEQARRLDNTERQIAYLRRERGPFHAEDFQ